MSGTWLVVISENQAKSVGKRLAYVLTALVFFKLYAYYCPSQGGCIYIYEQTHELRRTRYDWLASKTLIQDE